MPRKGSADPTSIPYTLQVQAVQTDNREWVYRVEYVEIDGCTTEGPDLLRALHRLDELREMRSTETEAVVNDIYHIHPKDVPWIPVAAGVAAKPLRFAAGDAGWVSIVRIDPGHSVPLHRHSGEVQGIVLEGRCQYRGESAWLEPGTYVHEADGAEDEIIACPNLGASILFIVQGPRVEYLSATGGVSHVDDQRSKQATYVKHCTENSLEPANLWH